MAELFDVQVQQRWPLSGQAALDWGLSRGRGCQRLHAFLEPRGDAFVGLRLKVETTHSDARVGFDNVFMSRVLFDGLRDRSLFDPVAELLRGRRRGGFAAGEDVPVLIARADYRPGRPDSPVSGGLRDGATFDVLAKAEIAASLEDTWTSTAWPGIVDSSDLPLLTGPDDVRIARADAAWLDADAWVDTEQGYESQATAPMPVVRDVAVSAHGVVFIATTEGLLRAEPGELRPIHLGKKKAKQDAQCVAVIGDLTFVGTHRRGLFILHPDGRQENILGGKGKTLPSRNVVSLAPYVEGGLIVGLRNAVMHRAEDGSWTQLPFPEGTIERVLTDGADVLCRIAGTRGGSYHSMVGLGGTAVLRGERSKDLRRAEDGSLSISAGFSAADGPYVGGRYTTTPGRSPFSLCAARGVLVHAGVGPYAIEHPHCPGLSEYFRYERPQAVFSQIASAGRFVVLAGIHGAVRVTDFS